MMLKKFKVKIFLAVSLVATAFGHAEEGLVSMNFEDADLRVLIRFVSEITGENFVVDEALKGKATIVGPSKIPVAQLRRVLESVLTVSGYALVSSGSVTKVVGVESARASAQAVSAGEPLPEGERFVTQIVPLKFANAEKMTGLVHPFLTQGGHASFYAPTNTLIVSDRATNVVRLTHMLSELDRKARSGSSALYVYSLKHADADGVAEVLTRLFEKEKGFSPSPAALQESETPLVVADQATNALLIQAGRDRYGAIRRVIRRLDVKRKQILVEVLIAEVNLDKAEKLGIEWAAIEGALYGSRAGFGQDRVNRADDIAHHVLTGGKFQGTSAGYLHDTIRIGTLEIPRLGILVNAFRNHSDINILSTPQILTTDHAEAEILVGENRAFIKNAQVTPEGSTVRTFEFKDVGLNLRLKPHLEPGGVVRMEVHQKVEDVLGETFEGAVETSKREAHTLISVRDSQTAVIGGLIREKKAKTLQKVPILGDIPILGLPFTRKAHETVKTNLLIFICPHILDSDEKLAATTDQKRQALEK